MKIRVQQVNIKPSDTVFDAVQRYPRLKDQFEEIAPEYRNLKNPVLFNAVARRTTLRKAAYLAGFTPEGLLKRIEKKLIYEK